APERLPEPCRYPLGKVRSHVREDRREEFVLGSMNLEEAANEAVEGGQTACPFEEGGFSRGLRIAEADVPVAARAEGLVLALTARAEAVVLEGGAFDPRDGVSVLIGERKAAGDAVGAVLGHLDRRLPNGLVDILPNLAPVDGEAQRTRRAVAHRS